MRETGFNPWVGKIPWRRERLPTPVFWPGEFHGLYSPWGRKELDTTKQLSLYFIEDLQCIRCWVGNHDSQMEFSSCQSPSQNEGSFPFCPLNWYLSLGEWSPSRKHSLILHCSPPTTTKLAQLPLSWCLHQSYFRVSELFKHVSGMETQSSGSGWWKGRGYEDIWKEPPPLQSAPLGCSPDIPEGYWLMLREPSPELLTWQSLQELFAISSRPPRCYHWYLPWSYWPVCCSTTEGWPFFPAFIALLVFRGQVLSLGYWEHIMDTEKSLSSSSIHDG